MALEKNNALSPNRKRDSPLNFGSSGSDMRFVHYNSEEGRQQREREYNESLLIENTLNEMEAQGDDTLSLFADPLDNTDVFCGSKLTQKRASSADSSMDQNVTVVPKSQNNSVINQNQMSLHPFCDAPDFLDNSAAVKQSNLGAEIFSEELANNSEPALERGGCVFRRRRNDSRIPDTPEGMFPEASNRNDDPSGYGSQHFLLP